MDNQLFRYVVTRIAVITIIVCSVLLIFSGQSDADDYADVSLGMFDNSRPSLSNVKFGEVGHRDDVGFGFFNQYEGGGWIQENDGDGRKSSGYVADQVGIKAENGLSMHFAVGPALITTPDSYLGGNFQFTEDLFIGIKGDNGNTIGFKYKHFSSAGLEMPNQGRDFGGLEISVPW